MAVPSTSRPERALTPARSVSDGGITPACGPDACAAPPASAAGAREVPIACDLSVFTPAERRAHRALFDEVVLGRAHAIHELEDGYVYQYTSPTDSELLLALARWVANERRCCPFLWFGLEVEPEGSALRLQLRGREGVKALLAAELDARGALGRVVR